MGRSCELLSVVERRNGDLIIIPQFGINHESPSGNKEIVRQKISVHNSRRSTEHSYTIKHEMGLYRDITRDFVQFTEPKNSYLLSYIHGRTFPIQTPSRYTLHHKESDEIIYISDISVPHLCIVEHILCHREPFEDDTFLKFGFSQITLAFRDFYLTLLHAIFPVVALPGSDWVRIITSLPRERQDDEVVFLQKAIPTFEDVRNIVIENTIYLRNLTIIRRESIIRDSPGLLDKFCQMEHLLCPDPVLQWMPFDFYKKCPFT